MSGIFGLIDPGGVDEIRLRSACERVRFRGEAAVLCTGSAGIGAFVPGPGDVAVQRGDGTYVAFDGRLPRAVRSPRNELHGRVASAESVSELLDREGLAGLLRVPGEFALARYTTRDGCLFLARDAFGLRPLYTAGRGSHFAFASDPEVLFDLRVASSELNPGAVSRGLAGLPPEGDETAFRDVAAVLPGHWLRVDLEGRRDGGRWFHPEALAPVALADHDAVEAVKEAVGAAVVDRAYGKRVAISLSGGRDSGSLAMASAAAGVPATAITQVFDDDLPVHEEHLAREVCDRIGFVWRPARVTSSPTWQELEAVPRWSGTPLAPGWFPQWVAPADEARDADVELMMVGEGGEPLFSAADVAVWDLLRSGQLNQAVRAARGYHADWGYGYGRLVRAAVRAAAPRQVMRARERLRRLPPWVAGRLGSPNAGARVPRSEREALLCALLEPHPTAFDAMDRLYQQRGGVVGFPFLDLRVVRVALGLTLSDRAPIERPKPLLARAFLDEFAEDRVKMSFLPYYDRLASELQRAFPALFSERSRACRAGLVDPVGVREMGSAAWRARSLPVAVLELWLHQPV